MSTLGKKNPPSAQPIQLLKLAVLAALCVIILRTATVAQTFTVLYNFTGGADGGSPVSQLALDSAGNLYGAAFVGGAGYGTDFELSPGASGWEFNVLYTFQGYSEHDGGGPSGIILGPQGNIFGMTQGGGIGCQKALPEYEGCGTVYELSPPPMRTERVLYRFPANPKGVAPYGLGPIALRGGSIYNPTFQGGSDGSCIYGYSCGTVFKLTPASGTWNESVLWDFGSGDDGAEPASNVTFDAAGNMYGTTIAGGDGSACSIQGHSGCGAVYELSPSGSGWTEKIIYNFAGGADGAAPYSGVISDSAGNLYGATATGGSGGGGTIYELSPSTGGWIFNVLYSFASAGFGPNSQCFSCTGPYVSLITDEAGNLYGTTFSDGAFGSGMAFELAHSGGGWTFTDLHDFTGASDGAGVWSGLVRDSTGNLYGQDWVGGADGYGVVFEITP